MEKRMSVEALIVELRRVEDSRVSSYKITSELFKEILFGLQELDRYKTAYTDREEKLIERDKTILEFVDGIKWIGQTIHQGHNHANPTFLECTMNTCDYCRQLLSK